MRAKHVFVTSIVTAILFSMLTVSPAAAQPQAYAPPGTAPAQPNGNGAPENGAATMPMNGGYQPSYYPEQYDSGTGSPGRAVRAAPPALTRRAIARAEFRRMQTGLDLMILEMKKAFERSRDYSSAMAEEREAFEALERERNEALRSVRDDPHYQASVSLRQNLTDQIAQRREDRHSSVGEILTMAEVKMGYARDASAMESAALAADPDVQQARERLRRASSRASELRMQHDQSVRNSPELEVARRDLKDARIAKLAAEVYYQGVREARDIALDYAYYTRRYDQYKYLSYGYYGYNYPHHGGGHRIGYPIGYPY